ncbi:MAG: serine hydrolase [Melioribacteraceae bacterium]|nr:serine hydrolase [Melioribacteraceae bacterium]
MIKKLIIILLFFFNAFAQVPEHYTYDASLSEKILSIVKELELDKDFEVGEDGIEQISLAVIDLSKEKPVLAGVNFDNYIYPASVYKIYIAAEILRQVSDKKLNLYDRIEVKSPNDVDRSKEIKSDPRPLLTAGDTVTINYLIDLMITRSDNSAANCLIDIADRKNINELIENYNWHGSEVTRKFLSRRSEDPGYEKIRGTETCALHAADFMYLVYTNQLVNHWVSMQIKTFLGRQLDNSKLAQGLPRTAVFYHKTGWFSYWTNDVGIVDDGKTKYIISCFIPVKEKDLFPKMKIISERIYDLMRFRD